MSDTTHHKAQFRRHAPGWFRKLLNRLYRRKADRELKRLGEVMTKKPKGADWEWW